MQSELTKEQKRILFYKRRFNSASKRKNWFIIQSKLSAEELLIVKCILSETFSDQFTLEKAQEVLMRIRAETLGLSEEEK